MMYILPTPTKQPTFLEIGFDSVYFSLFFIIFLWSQPNKISQSARSCVQCFGSHTDPRLAPDLEYNEIGREGVREFSRLADAASLRTGRFF